MRRLLKELAIPTADNVAQRMLALLPTDGTPVLNRVMRVMVSRDLESPVSQELYFQARDKLLADGCIGRLRGQGGQLFLIPPQALSKKRPSGETEPWAEAKLMAPLRFFLEQNRSNQAPLSASLASSLKFCSTAMIAGPHFVWNVDMRFENASAILVDSGISASNKSKAGSGASGSHRIFATVLFCSRVALRRVIKTRGRGGFRSVVFSAIGPDHMLLQNA
jgi:hypothetical protein